MVFRKEKVLPEDLFALLVFFLLLFLLWVELPEEPRGVLRLREALVPLLLAMWFPLWYQVGFHPIEEPALVLLEALFPLVVVFPHFLQDLHPVFVNGPSLWETFYHPMLLLLLKSLLEDLYFADLD